MDFDRLDGIASTETRPTLDYAPTAPGGTRRWWHGSVWDWLGSIALVLLGIALLVLAFMGLAYFWLTIGR